MHVHIFGQPAAFSQVTRATGRNDIVPAGPATHVARYHMVKRQIIRRTAIDALKPITQEHVEPCKSRRSILFDEFPERNHGWQAHLK